MDTLENNKLNHYEILNVNLYVGKIHIIKNISFQLKRNAITAILGANGSGKSTLLNHLAMKYSNEGKKEINSFSFVAQKDYLDPFDTVAGQFKFQAQLDNIKQTKQDILSSSIYKALGIDKIWTNRINSLSGGQKRSVALALSLIKKPEFLILDEPTSSLDIDARNKFWNAILEYKKSNPLTLLYVTHNMWEVDNFADNILVLKNGELICNASKNTFSNLVNGNVITIDIPKISERQENFISEVSKKLNKLEILCSSENNIKYINNNAYNLEEMFNTLKPIVTQPSGKPARISVNSPSITDCYYYVLEKKEGTFSDV